MRCVNALVSFLVVPVIACLYYKVFKDKLGTFVIFALLALNWKFIVHAHYVNADALLATLVACSFLFLYLYQEQKTDTKYTVLTAIFFGLCVGTKITALISLPFFVYIFWQKRAWKNLFAFCLVAFGVFCVSNPFSIIFFQDFAQRIFEMFGKEGGMVFDSVDSSPFKYVVGLSAIITFPALLVSLYGNYKSLKSKSNYYFHIFLVSNIVVYLLFYSIQSRRVDRWLLPIIPLVLFYAARGVTLLKNRLDHKSFFVLGLIIMVVYIYYPIKVVSQFTIQTPRTEAYLWLRDKITLNDPLLVYTEEGMDPMTKLPGAKVVKFNVYVTENAQLDFPRDPNLYSYVVISTRAMQSYKKYEVLKAYPYYVQRWGSFENTLENTSRFELIKSFTVTRPNLIPLTDILIYKNLNYSPAKVVLP